MGASGWHCTVAYQGDIEAALEQARHDAYARGAYYLEEPDPTHRLTEEEFRATLRPEDEQGGINESLLDQWRQAQQLPTPVDPDTLFVSQPESGTHSIIDMAYGVSAEPANCTVSPLTPDQLRSLFGTVTPASEQVETWLAQGGYAAVRRSWQGVYVIGYRPDGTPAHLHFGGFSGD